MSKTVDKRTYKIEKFIETGGIAIEDILAFVDFFVRTQKYSYDIDGWLDNIIFQLFDYFPRIPNYDKLFYLINSILSHYISM